MGLNLNYQPVKLVDITTLTNEQWLQWRLMGLGGSDVASALGLSPYKTARDLYHNKIGIDPVIGDEDKSITFEIGHLLEDVVAKIFAKKTGFTVYEDHWMYQHPLFPFMIADVDRFIDLPGGKRGILECKTAHPDMRFAWANGAVPRHYEMQVKHYMSVMNIDVAYIACLFSNREDDFVWRKIERDLDEEESTIQQLGHFWHEFVEKRVEPPMIEKPDQVLESLRRFYGPADTSASVVILDRKFIPALQQIQELKEQKQQADALVRNLDSQIKTLYVPIVDLMGSASEAVCKDGKATFQIKYEPKYRTAVPKNNLSKLEAQHPDIYADYVETTESRCFKLSKVDTQ